MAKKEEKNSSCDAYFSGLRHSICCIPYSSQEKKEVYEKREKDWNDYHQKQKIDLLFFSFNIFKIHFDVSFITQILFLLLIKKLQNECNILYDFF
jgi:hypothetical protein